MSAMRRAWSDVFVFGRSTSAKAQGKVERRLAECLPAADWPVYNEDGDLKAFKGWHVFGSETARNHFIKHALILLSNNGQYDLSNLNFDNFFARSYSKDGVIWFTASIVVTAPGDYRIRHSIVATRAGTTKTAAFQLLMLDVEAKLDTVLRGDGVNSGRASPKQPKKLKQKGSMAAVSIIAKPSEAMAPPKLDISDDYNTWTGGPFTMSPKRNGTQLSASSKSSQDTQNSIASSQRSDSTQATATSEQAGSEQKNIAYQPQAQQSVQRALSRSQTEPLQRISEPQTPTLVETATPSINVKAGQEKVEEPPSRITQATPTPSPATASQTSTALDEQTLASLTSANFASKPIRHTRNASSPFKPMKTPVSPTSRMKRHASQPLQAKFNASQFLGRLPSPPPMKPLPPLPRSSSLDKVPNPIETKTVDSTTPETSSMEELILPSVPEQETAHPTLRSNSHSEGGLKSAVSSPCLSKQPSAASGSSSVYSRTPVSPFVEEKVEKEAQGPARSLQTLRVEPCDADIPEPLCVEKEVIQMPGRVLEPSNMAFEIYV